ncbi:deleted in malignant brain tumors 1 protein-like [Dendronephthya gigantea]|uniref:deleted in malignant brain tumors 1 protein-like n=1 Tax=Dendronephthya gigantea TaxID=151771 RepID=UPI00106AB0C6|nr:deleted in malignant brain tumors 1 protein-like [Dendronephthya gigantea]
MTSFAFMTGAIFLLNQFVPHQCQDGSLRLQGPSSWNGAGRIEVLHKGHWGTICDDGWDMKDAKVACRHLGYKDVARTLQRNEVPSGSGNIWLVALDCTGDEENITSCYHNGWGIHSCSHTQDAGMKCSTTGFDTNPIRVRLQGPLSGNGIGRVEILYHGYWGTICDYGWDIRDARVVCRELGYDLNLVHARTLYRNLVPSDPSSSRQIWLAHVACNGKENNIRGCSHNGWGVNYCSHSQDAGVECSSTEVLIRLQGPISANGTGRVEVFYNNEWGTICDNRWDIRDAQVVCRQLGYKDAARALHGGQVPSGSGRIWLGYVDCNGKEQNITSCHHRGWGVQYCSHSEDAGVECTTTDFSPIPVRLRLQGPLSENGTGRVEVFYNGYWGTICDDGWDLRDARVACRQLGYRDAFRPLQRYTFPSGSGQIWLAYVACKGEEQNIASCTHSPWGVDYCSHYQDAGVKCSKTDYPADIKSVKLRLQGPHSANGTGRVEVFYHGYWGTICDYGWDMRDARVVCRQLGYDPDNVHVRTLQRYSFPSGSGQIWLANIVCTGDEQNLTSCSHDGWGDHSCSHYQDAGVECISKAVLVRLQGPLSSNGTGRVEVFLNGIWGTICDRGWDITDARVVCRQFGYPDAVRALKGWETPPRFGRTWLSGVACTGEEQSILSCPHNNRPWWHIHYLCYYYRDAGVECSTEDFSATPVLVRLQGPQSSNGTGRVEVFFHGIWGTICENGWDIRDARVLCRQLGYLDAVRTLRRNEVASGSGQIWLNFVDCTGEEQNITSCSHSPWGDNYCSHYYDVGVECSTTDISTTPVAVRLQGPLSKNGIGRVEVFYNGYWGTICDYGWDINDAKVVCRQLGFPDTVRTLPRNLVPSGSAQIWLAYVACTGKEQNITSCPNNNWGKTSCSHYQDAGVECSRSVITVSPRLQGPLSEDGTGRVEIFYNGTWGTICDNGWDMKDARVLCRQLGFKDVARELRSGQFPSGSGQVWLQSVDCTGSERDIARCSHSGWGVTSYYCQHSKDVGVECSRTDFSTTPVLLRLQGPVSEKGAGRVEVLYHGYWGTICGYSWSMRDATVVCRQLGYLDAVKTLQRNEFPPGSGQIWLSQITCTGKEQNITSCSHQPWGDHYCSHNNDVGVECSTTDISTTSVAVRLQGPLSKNGIGRVEVFYHGYWGTICDDGWDMNDAKVVCRQLGFPDTVRTLQKNLVPSGSGRIWLAHVACTGKEPNITSCPNNNWGKSSCSHYQDAGVECSRTVITVSLRLQGPLSEDGTGRVEVFYNDTWGTICDNGWDMKDARVICRQLGFKDVARELRSGQFPSGSGQVWLQSVDCTGSERDIARCSHSGWGVTSYDCKHSKDVGVECSRIDFSTTPVLLRLQGPVSEKGAGRVEVLYHGYWGTICDYSWSMRDATVVCRQLGYLDAVKTLQRNEFPPGSGQIWLSQVACTGKEQNITSCSHRPWGDHYCSHNNDVGVECSTTAITAPIRLEGPSRKEGIGRVEIFYNGKWGTICDSGWDLRDARVACRQLGYPDAVRALERNSVPSGSGRIWLMAVSCTGEEQNIASCFHNGWGVHSCHHNQDAGVQCSATERPNVTVNCSSFIAVNLGDDITCLCEGKGGKPPANVTWYKDGVQFGDTEQEQNVLNLSNVSETDNGTYTCVGKSHTLTDEKSIEVDFNYEKSHSKRSKDGTKWYISLIIVVAVIIVVLCVAYAVVYCRRRWLGNRNGGSSTGVQDTNADQIYEEIDLKIVPQKFCYQSPKGSVSDGYSRLKSQ